MSARGPAGSKLLELVRNHYLMLISGNLRDADGSGRRRFVRWVLSNPELGEALKRSLRLAEELQRERVEALASAGYSVLAVYFTLSGPGLVGTGSGVFKSIFEVGMSVDWLLGLPYYPESTLKGASRSACESLLPGEVAREVCGLLYGITGQAGLILHGPALPVGCRSGSRRCTIYWGDVITPHYYRGGSVVEREIDAQPNPVVHLSIAPGTVFLTYLAARIDDKVRDELEGLLSREQVVEPLRRLGGNPLQLAAVFTLSALVTGFAARASKGYNIAEPDSSLTGVASPGELGNVLSSVSKNVVRVFFHSSSQSY